MAPEYLSTGRATPAADVFALGVVAWETLSRRRLHDDSGGEPVWPPRPNSIAPPSNYVTGIPRAVDDVILRALALDPEDRFASAKSFGAALERALGSGQIATRQQVGATISERFGPRLDARREMLKHATPVDPRERMPSKPDLLSIIADNTPRPTVEELSPLPVTYRTRNRMARLAAFVGASIVVMGAVMVSLFVRKSDEGTGAIVQGAAQPRLANVAASTEPSEATNPSTTALRLQAPAAGGASATRLVPGADRAPITAVVPTQVPTVAGRVDATPADPKPSTSAQPPLAASPAVPSAAKPSKPASYVLTPPTIAPDNPYDR